MPQQINLCLDFAEPQRQRFPASTMFLYLAVSFVLLLAIGGFWLWNMGQSSRTYTLTLESQANEIKNLQAAIQISRAAASPVDPALLRELQDQRAVLQQREKMLKLVQEGMYSRGRALRPAAIAGSQYSGRHLGYWRQSGQCCLRGQGVHAGAVESE